MDLDTNTNSSSDESKSHIEAFILIILMLLKSDKGFGLGKKCVKGCLSLFNYFVDMNPTLMSPFFVKKTCFLKEKTCFL